MNKGLFQLSPRMRLLAFLAGLSMLSVTSWVFFPAPPLYLLSAMLVCAFQFYLVFRPKVQAIIHDEKLSDLARAIWSTVLWLLPLQFSVAVLSGYHNLPFPEYIAFALQWICIWIFCFTFVAFYATYWRKDKPRFGPF